MQKRTVDRNGMPAPSTLSRPNAREVELVRRTREVVREVDVVVGDGALTFAADRRVARRRTEGRLRDVAVVAHLPDQGVGALAERERDGPVGRVDEHEPVDLAQLGAHVDVPREARAAGHRCADQPRIEDEQLWRAGGQLPDRDRVVSRR